MRRLLTLLLLAPLLVCVTAAHAELKVVTTLSDLAALAAEVGGEHVQVTHLAAPQEDPHYVDPRPSFILALNRADVLIINGMELEAAWLAPLLVQARNPKIQPGAPGYIDASVAVQPLEVPVTVDRGQGDIHGGGNPHFLVDPRAARAVVALIGKRFVVLDQPNALTYARNAQTFGDALKAVAEQQRQRFDALPPEKRRVVAYHQSLSYLWNWLGLIQVQTVEPKPGIPPNPAHTARVLGTMKAQKAHVIVQEEFYPAKISQTLARLAGGTVVKLPGGTRFADGERYITRVKRVADLLYAALR